MAMVLGGWMCSSQFLGGWPSVFYIFGAVGMVWGVPWFLVVRNRPEEHPRISSEELRYITANIGPPKTKKVLFC